MNRPVQRDGDLRQNGSIEKNRSGPGPEHITVPGDHLDVTAFE